MQPCSGGGAGPSDVSVLEGISGSNKNNVHLSCLLKAFLQNSPDAPAPSSGLPGSRHRKSSEILLRSFRTRCPAPQPHVPPPEAGWQKFPKTCRIFYGWENVKSAERFKSREAPFSETRTLNTFCADCTPPAWRPRPGLRFSGLPTAAYWLLVGAHMMAY